MSIADEFTDDEVLAESAPPPQPAPAPTAKPQKNPSAPWYECFDNDLGQPRDGCEPFQSEANTQAGVHVVCPNCGRRTVRPLDAARV